jgi:hypothetical protein
MIDVHVILLGNENRFFLKDCILSLREEPIALHVCEGIIGGSVEARRRAIAKGTNEWVGWVDPDDAIVPGSYQKLLDAVGDKKFAWTKEEVWYYNVFGQVVQKGVRTSPHHMHIIHRDLIKPEFFDSPHPDRWTALLAPEGVFVDEIGYIWRNYPASNAKIHNKHY